MEMVVEIGIVVSGADAAGGGVPAGIAGAPATGGDPAAGGAEIGPLVGAPAGGADDSPGGRGEPALGAGEPSTGE